MIRLEQIRKSFRTGRSQKIVANNISAVFPTGQSVALLGRNGAGKSTLLQIIAGTMESDSGRVISDGTISWPVGFAGSFHKDLTGAQNTRFVARVYGIDTDSLSDFVEDFSELGGHFHMPLRTYSSGMKSRLSFGVSMGIRFDTYLIDEVTSVGDAQFKKKSSEVFLDRIQSSGAILVSHSLAKVRRLCTAGAVLENGYLTHYDDVNDAIQVYKQTMGITDEDDDDDD